MRIWAHNGAHGLLTSQHPTIFCIREAEDARHSDNPSIGILLALVSRIMNDVGFVRTMHILRNSVKCPFDKFVITINPNDIPSTRRCEGL